MDELASSVLATLKKSSASAEAKITALNSLKSNIKHQRVPESAQAITLECLRMAITSQVSPSLVTTGLSCLGHLIKRLTLQDQTASLFSGRVNLLVILLEKLGDQKETQRAAGSSLLCDLYSAKPVEVEKIVKEGAIQGSNVRAKIAGMQWVTTMHVEHNLQFRSFVPSMVECLEDADGMVRESAKVNLVELFRYCSWNARDAAKADLKRQLIAHNVRKSIAEHILSQLALPGPPEAGSNSSISPTARPQTPQFEQRFPDGVTEPSLPPSAEIVSIDPLYVYTQRELEDMFRAMQPCFEGKESEDNWKARDQNVLKMRRLLKGNTPQEHHAFFVTEVKNLLDGILKVANSLRTTMSTNGCNLIQEFAQTMNSAIDPMAEIILRGFEKMCAATKHIAAQNANATVTAVFTHSSYTARHMQHILAACGDKNAQPRQFASGWLQIMLKKQMHNKGHFEHSGGLEAAEKSIKKGLTDANPKVRELMRGTYWVFATTWPDRAELIMSTLDTKSKQLLEKDSSNPNASQPPITFTASVGPSASVNPRAPISTRVSLKDAIAAQRNAAKRMPDRPTSAMSTFTPSRPGPASTGRAAAKASSSSQRAVTGATSNGSIKPNTLVASGGQNSLMSAPVRRPKRPDAPRPATADPYARRNETREVTPDRSPAISPRPMSKSSMTSKPSSHVKSQSTTTIGAAASASSAASSKVQSPRISPSKVKTRTGVLASHAALVLEENSTAVIPDGTLCQRAPLAPPRLRNNENDRPHSGHSSQLGTVDEDKFTLVIPDKSKSNLTSPPPFLEEDNLVKVKVELNDDDAMMVYEDPAVEDIPPPSTGEAPVVLEEKAANEQNVIQQHAESVDSSNQSSESSPPQPSKPDDQNRQETRSISPTKRSVDPFRSTSPTKRPTTASSTTESPLVDRAEILKARRLLASGTERVRARTLDAHGFRRLQELIKTHAQTPDVHFGPLLGALVDSLKCLPPSADAIGKTGNGTGLNRQALGAVKAIVTLYVKRDEEVRDMVPHVLVGFAEAGDIWEGERVGGALELEKAAEEVVRKITTLEPGYDERNNLLNGCVDAVAGLIEKQASPNAEKKERKMQRKAIALALLILTRLIPRILVDYNSSMPEAMLQRLAQLAVSCLSDLEPDVRRKGVELALELYAAFPSLDRARSGEEPETNELKNDKKQFWTLLQPAGEQSCNLLAYYLARQGKVGAASTPAVSI